MLKIVKLSKFVEITDKILSVPSGHDVEVWYGIVGFNVPLDTSQVISETILRITWPNQQHHSIEEWWLVNPVKGQSH